MQERKPLKTNIQANKPAKFKTDILPSEKTILPAEKQGQLNRAFLDAVQYGHTQTCAVLVQECAKEGGDVKGLIAIRGNGGWTPLHYAAKNEQTQTCALLMKKYAEANGDIKELIAAKNDNGFTPLHLAAFSRRTKTCALLMKKYAEANGDIKELIAARTHTDDIALHFAAWQGPVQICTLLVEKYSKAGGSVKELLAAKDGKGNTVLDRAAQSYYPTAQFLTAKLLEAAFGKEAAAAFLKSFGKCVAT
jgi:ankyrin repeat protein